MCCGICCCTDLSKTVKLVVPFVPLACVHPLHFNTWCMRRKGRPVQATGLGVCHPSYVTWELLLHAGQMGVPNWNALNGVHTNTCASETAVDAFRVGGRVLYINDKGSVEET